MAATPHPRTYSLVRQDNGASHAVREGARTIVGRGTDADLPVADATLSRRHAELDSQPGQLTVCDLGSSNGTFVNGRRIERAPLAGGDVVTFGNVAFRVVETMLPAYVDAPAEATIVGLRAVPRRSVVLSSTPEATTVLQAMPLAAQELTQRKLALLLEVSTALSRVTSIDALLEQIAGYVFQIMDVDRVALLLTTADGELVPHVARDRHGSDAARAVPRSIARRVVAEKIAVLTDNAPMDERFAGASIVMQSVRSAMCAPLIGIEGAVHGVLYVDNLTATHRFDDGDLEFLVAFSGIAAVAIENGRYAERIQREALARSNFERFFTPALAARIASAPDALRLGGEKRRVVILFSDIRGFTPLTEHMPPDAVATLLNEYFTAMVECVFRHGGTLDKFIGDAIMAQWGAPVASADDADRALAAAFDMVSELAQLNAGWRAAARQEVHIGIGLNIGEVFAGYIGSERRLEYTILGDPVNLASRLCSAAARGEVLVTGELLAQVRARPICQDRGELKLKGLSRPIPVFAVTPHTRA